MSAPRVSRRAFSWLQTRRLAWPAKSCLKPRPREFNRTNSTYHAPDYIETLSVIPTTVDTTSPEYRENDAEYGKVIAKLQELVDKTRKGGPPKAIAKHLERNKMLPRDRIDQLVDPGTTFLELSPLAGHELYGEEEVPCGGILTGVGVVEGVRCVIVANDSTVKGGTYYPITVKKHLRAQAIAEENSLP
jgi:3-methylcrotonyl-CoA carboxylase beta subunit